MARTRLTVVDLDPTHPGGAQAYTFAAHDTVNENDFLISGREVLLISNTDASSQDVVISSTPDSYGRTGDLTISVAAGTREAIAFLDRSGWMQSDGALYLDCTSANIEYAVLRLPA